MANQIPCLDGVWKVRGKTLQYSSPTDRVDICRPDKVGPLIVTIKQCGRFFTYRTKGDDRPPKLGVLERVYLRGKFKGWKGHRVDTKLASDKYLFNCTKIKHNE